MAYRPILNPNEMLDVVVETPEMVENARMIACGERQLRMLRRMGDIGLSLVERLEEIAISRAEAASRDGAGPEPIDDIAGAYGKLTQSVRRTLAMEARLAEEMKARRLGVFVTQNTLRTERAKAAHECVDATIEHALTRAIRRERPDSGREAVEDLLVDMFERLNDTEDFEDYQTRPPGETVAKLCATFGLDPDFCIQADDETWMIRYADPPDIWKTRPDITTDPRSPDLPRPDGGACPLARATRDAEAVCSSP